MQIRQAEYADLGAVLGLYAQLHPGQPEPPPSEALSALWARILADPNRHIILVERERVVSAGCELLIVPNLTHHQRPWAVVENLVTDAASRRRGCGSTALAHAVHLAQQAGCYKIMLATGRTGEAAHALYRKAGFNSEDKTCYVRWLSHDA